MAVRAVLGQQISVSGATTLAGRLVDAFGEPLPHADAGLSHAFSTAERIAAADLRGMGLTAARASTLQTLARAVADGRIDVSPRADRERTTAALLELPGFGPWTVAYIAMRALRDPDAIPSLTWAFSGRWTGSAFPGKRPIASRARRPGARGAPTGRCTCGRALRRRLTDRLQELLPKAERVNILNASHVLHYENPATVNSAVLDFIARH